MQAILNLSRLALPMTITRLGYLAFTLVDIAVVGHLASDELAFQAAAVGVLSPPLLIGVGFLIAVTVLVAQAHGQGDVQKAQRYFRLGFIYALIIGFACAALAFAPHLVLSTVGFEHDIVIGAAPIFRIIAVSLLFQLLFTVPSDFLEAIGKPRMVMVIIVVANLINLVANIWFVGGGLGLPPMGAVGSAWATFVIRFIIFVLIFGWIIWGPVGKIYNLSLSRLFVVRGLQQRAFLKIGIASALALGIESTAFAVMLVFAGWIGKDELAAFNIALNTLATVFMLSLGIASAAAVLVGNAIGDQNLQRARSEGVLALSANTVFMAALSIPFFFAAPLIAGSFTQAENLLAIATPLIALSALIMIFDGGQVVTALITRATGDAITPTLVYLLCYGFLMIPLGYVFAIPFGWGTMGLYGAITLAGLFSVTLMGWRFIYMTSGKKQTLYDES